MASPAKRQCCGASRELMDAIARENWTVVKNILSESSLHVADSVVTQLINKNQWSAVRQIVECVEDEDRTWDIGGVLVKNNILLSVADRDWTCITESSHGRFLEKTFQWIIKQACTQVTDIEFVLSHCADDRLDSVLTILVERRQWRAVGQVLVRGVSDSLKQWAVREACKHCQHEDSERFGFRSSFYYQRYLWVHVTIEEFLIRDILPHCADDQLGSVLTTLVERRLWRAVGVILKKKGVSDSDKQWAVLEACKHCKEDVAKTYTHRWLLNSQSHQEYDSPVEQCLLDDILPHCAVDHMDSVLATLVERRLWHVVLYVLKRGVSDSSKRWVVLEVCACCESVSREEISEILLFCADDQADCVLTTLVERRQWVAVGKMLNKDVSDSCKQWAVRESCKYCENYGLESLIQNLLPHCADDQLDSVLTTLVKRRLWQAVLYVLKRGVSDSSERWVVLEVCACCESASREEIPEILLFCADDQADCVLTTLVERRLWRAVGEMLKKGVSESCKQWAVEEACKYFNKDAFKTNYTHWRLHSQSHQEYYSHVEKCFVNDILPHCADDQVLRVLTALLERRMWLAVGVILNKKGVSDSNKQWAVQEACKHCEGYELVSLIQNILPHCGDDQLDSVLTTLVERRLWQAVLYVLKRGVSDSSERWVVLEVCACCESASREEIPEILLFCADDLADCVLTTLVERHLWRVVGKILKKGVSDSNKQWAVQEACKHCKEDVAKTYTHRWRLHSQSHQEYDSPVEQCLLDDILPHCADDQLDSVLTTLVERRLWQAVLYVLKRGVSDSSKRWVVLEVCSFCESAVRLRSLSHILIFCADDNVDDVLTILVEQRKWWAVGEMLREGVSDVNERKTIRELNEDSSRLSSDEFNDEYNLPPKQYVEWLQQGVSEAKRRWAMEEAGKAAKSKDFIRYVLPHCSFSSLDSIMPDLVKQGELEAVHAMMRKYAKEMEMDSFVLPCWYVDVLPSFIEHHLWNYVKGIFHSAVMKLLCHWVKRGEEIKEDDSVLWAIVNCCRVNVKDAAQFSKVVKKDITSHVHTIQKRLGLTDDLCDLLYTSLVQQVCVALCSDGKLPEIVTGSIKRRINLIYNKLLEHLETSVDGIMNQLNAPEFKTSGKLAVLNDLSSSSLQLFFHVLQQFNLYYVRRRGHTADKSFVILLSMLPLVPELQSVALRIMLRDKRWDVISQADLSGVWEQDRRHLLQAAVKQRQWSVVKRWADHTLYDDQRVWALNEALNEKQWDVALLLADHGLTDIDLMRVHYRLAKYADWDVILHMFERGADVAEVKERLGRMKDNKRIPENVICCINDRCREVKTLETNIQMAKSVAFKTACHCCNWMFVLFTLIRNPGRVSVHCALKVAIKKKAWHVVIQLVRIGMDAKQRHSLFSRMMKRRQWGVCRVLLEQGLSVQLCLKVLPQLMDVNQWALVARVMEHEVGDDVRQQVMQRAWERREGSVVWLCIKTLPTPLSVKERKALFQQAFSCELWQVIKPLVEEKDETGIRHRDTALLEAIDQHQWDLVDHCQRHHADINMKDDDGHTPLQRAAMKKDWEAVEELVVRDGDPNLLDREGYTVLHRAIEVQQWGAVHLLIQYHADIHKGEKSWYGGKGETPLNMLIDTKQGDVIERTLFWCPDQSKGVNDAGETTLHAVCLSGCYDSMYFLIARGVNPLAVTKTGQSALVYAVLNEDRPQRMVAECIRLGISTHQPKLTNIASDLKSLAPYYHLERNIWLPGRAITSPFLCAVLLGLPVVMKMLYDSGAVSQGELFSIYADLPKLAEPTSSDGTKVHELAAHCFDTYKKLNHCIKFAAPCLIGMATTPRSLESTCRLVISHCLTLSKTRHRDVDHLPLEDWMKNFVLFSDLTDPDFGEDTT